MKKLRITFFISFLLVSCGGISPEEARKDLASMNIPFEGYAFHEAAGKCDELIVDKFLAAELESEWGLAGAVEGRCIDLVKKLVKTTEDESAKGYSLNVIAKSDPQPDDLEIAKILIDSGTDPNNVIEGESSHLSTAIANENMPLIELLLKKGAKVNDYNDSHSFAITTAAGQSTELTQLLLDNGANADSFPCQFYRSDYCSPLLAATTAENPDTVSLLLANGADANDSENNIRSQSLEQATSQKNLGLVKKLVEAGAKINDLEKEYSEVLNKAFIRYYDDESREYTYSWDIVKYLLDNGAKAEPRREFITLAFENNQYDIARSIAKNGAEFNSVEISDNEERSSEHLVSAVRNNNLEAVKILLDYGANPNSMVNSSSTCNVLSIALHYDYQEIVKLLQEKGATGSQSRYCR